MECNIKMSKQKLRNKANRNKDLKAIIKKFYFIKIEKSHLNLSRQNKIIKDKDFFKQTKVQRTHCQHICTIRNVKVCTLSR